VADRENIYEFTPDGRQSTFASGLNQPQGMAFDREGILFVDENGTIDKFTPDGTKNTFTFAGNEGLAFDCCGNLFSADFGGDIFEVDSNGVPTVYASGLNEPIYLAFDSVGNLFVSCVAGGGFGDGYITKITTNGAQSFFASGLNQPKGLVFDSKGNLLVAEGETGNIYEYTTNGVQSSYAVVTNSSSEIAFDNAGDLFVTQPGNNCVVKIAPDGTQSLFASGLDNPTALAFQPLPVLNISLSGANAVSLSWPTNALGFTLQSTTNLNPPVIWTTVSFPPIAAGGFNVLTIPATNSQVFFQLAQ
jgi:hypothetical protein